MNIKERWRTREGKSFLKSFLRQCKRYKHNELCETPFGNYEGRIDARGLSLPEGTRICNTTFSGVDLSYASIRNARIENSHLSSVLLVGCDLYGMVDIGNFFHKCFFMETSLFGYYFGYNGSRYTECMFEKTDCREASGIRAEFDGSAFRDCNFKGVDFGASSFENCIFQGVLEDVWFRGGFPCKSDEDQFGRGRPNRMTNVSFEYAELVDCTFSNGCDLSSLRLPQDGKYYLLNKFHDRLMNLQNKVRTWPEENKEEASVFISCWQRHSKQQYWHILNINDLYRNHGMQTGRMIYEVLLEDLQPEQQVQ